MSLANDDDLIIPNTTGIISQAVKEANERVRTARTEAYKSFAASQENAAPYIRDIGKIHMVLQSRADGIPLEDIVNNERISNNKSRKENYEVREVAKEEHRAYESWYKE